MLRTTLFFSILSIIFYRCATLNINDINRLDKTPFDSLMLYPGLEPNDLRIDVLRQQHIQSDITDSTGSGFIYSDVPYSVVGFNLGNGMFYDRNMNLVFRIDHLLNFSPDSDFVLEIIKKPRNKKGRIEYSLKNDTLSYYYPINPKIHESYHLVRKGDTMFYYRKNHLLLSVLKTDTSLAYGRNRIRFNLITADGNIHYYSSGRGRRSEYFRLHRNIYLSNQYLISLSDDRTTIYIKKQGKKRNRNLYTIVRNNHLIFVYNKQYNGYKIEIKNNSLTVFYNLKKLAEYRLIARSDTSASFHEDKLLIL